MCLGTKIETTVNSTTMSVISSPSNKRRKLIDNDIRNEEEVHVVEAGRAAGYSSPRIGATDEEEQEDVKSNCAVILHRGADGELHGAIPDANFDGDSRDDLCNTDWIYSFEDEEAEKETKEMTVEKTVPEANYLSLKIPQ